MAEQVIRLVYPAHLLDVPIVNQLIRQHDLTFNILHAQITPEEGWMDIQLTGEPNAIAEAIQWLSSEGIEIQYLPK